MSQPQTTANNLYNFETLYHNQSLKIWIENAHKDMSRKSGWRYNPLQPGSFGYDNMAHSLVHVLSNYKKEDDRETLADLIHKGWQVNYIYWRDNKPWLKNKLYKAPAKPLNDKRRNDCATQSFKELPQDEKDKDLIIADFIFNNLK